jgi:hypothetical protein
MLFVTQQSFAIYCILIQHLLRNQKRRAGTFRFLCREVLFHECNQAIRMILCSFRYYRGLKNWMTYQDLYQTQLVNSRLDDEQDLFKNIMDAVCFSSLVGAPYTVGTVFVENSRMPKAEHRLQVLQLQ